ncbi:MAG: hypothetical protein ACKO8I_19825 [Cyanobacteriota bacterium]
MTVTPPPLSTPNIWPIDDELYAIDQQIADLQRTADQAQASSAVAASEVAIAQKAIRELSTAKAEILEKGRLWDRDAQMQRALAERKPVADRVRLALASGGGLAESLKRDLEERLKPKFKIATGPTTNLYTLDTAVVDAENALSDAGIKTAFDDAERLFKAAEVDYQAKAAAAEKTWLAIQNRARFLDETLQKAQAQYAEAVRLEAAAGTPTPAAGTNPAGPVQASAAEAGIAWKSFKDTFELLKSGTLTASGQPDDSETALITDWTTASTQAKNALAVLLTRRQELAVARNAHEQLQALRPARKPSEQAAMVASVLAAFNPPPPPGP